MYNSKDFTELRNWTLSNDVEVTINDLKEAFEELTRAADIPVSIIDIEIDNSLPAIKIRSTLNSNYMGIYVYCNSNMVGMALEGKGEQIKAPDLEKLFYKAVGTVAGVYDGYQKSKNIMRRFGVSGTASALGAGAGVAVGAAIGGSVRLVAKGVKALLRDKDAYEREMGFYELVLGLGDYLIGGVDPSNIISKLRSKAEEGNAVAQYLIGSAYVEGRGVEPSLDEAVRWFALAAANNEKRSKEILAVEYLYGEKEYSIDEKITGLKYLKELADNGDEDAAINIIDIYGFGSVDGIPADIPKMIEAAEVYADRGNTYAIMVLARTYDTVCNNEKVNDADYKDDAKAAIWYHSILTLEDREYMEEASMCLANMYMEGRGVEKSPEYATKCLNIAAKCGNIGAKAALAYYMTFGIGTEKDHIGAQKMCEDVIRAGDQKEKSIAYYCNYKIFDEAKKYKQSMEYARKCLECKTTDAAKTAELENYLSEKEELISKMTDEERREYLQERKPLFGRFKNKDKDGESLVASFINKKTILIIIGIIVVLVAAAFIVKGVGNNNKTEQSHSSESETIVDVGEKYKVATEKKKDAVFINDDTEILVQTEVDVPTITGNDALDSSVKEWAGSYEEEAEEFKEQCVFIDLEGLDPHSDEEFYGTEYPIYFYLRNTIYIPSEDVYYMETPRVDDKILSLLYHSYIEDGGAHGYSSYSAGNFDVESGELLSLDMIADNYEAFSDVTLSYIINLADEKNEEMMEYGSEMFSGYEDTIRSMWSEGYPNWYMSDTGLIFVYNAYELAPYADGTIIIEVPYSEISEYMKADYIKD